MCQNPEANLLEQGVLYGAQCRCWVYPKATVVNARSDVTFRCGSPFRTLMAVACVALVLRSLLSGTIEMRTELEEVVL